MERFVVISADCHAVGRPDDFTQYLESKYLDVYAESWNRRAEFAEGRAKASEEGGLLFSRETLDEYHGHEETEDVAGGTAGQWDSERRVKELEDDGVVAEVVFPNGGPFVTGRGGEPYSRELRTAGLLAYNRWLADFCAEARGRRAGIAQLPIHDVDLAISEIETAAAQGLEGRHRPDPLRRRRSAAALPRALRTDVGRVRGARHAGARARRRRSRLRRRCRPPCADHAVRHRGADVAQAHPVVPPLERNARAAPRAAPGVHRRNVGLGAAVGELPRLPLRVEGLRAHPRRASDEAE